MQCTAHLHLLPCRVACAEPSKQVGILGDAARQALEHVVMGVDLAQQRCVSLHAVVLEIGDIRSLGSLQCKGSKTHHARHDEVVLHADDFVGGAVLLRQVCSASDPFDNIPLHKNGSIFDLLLLLVESGQHANVLRCISLLRDAFRGAKEVLLQR